MIQTFDYSGKTLQMVTSEPSYRLVYENNKIILFGYYEVPTYVADCCQVEIFNTEQEGLDRISELGLYDPFSGIT